MAEIKWIAADKETSYCRYQRYLLKKRRVKGYYVYTVWMDDVITVNTYNEFEFLRWAKLALCA